MSAHWQMSYPTRAQRILSASMKLNAAKIQSEQNLKVKNWLEKLTDTDDKVGCELMLHIQHYISTFQHYS